MGNGVTVALTRDHGRENEKLCFAGAGTSSLQRYVQTIARIAQDKTGAYWFNALCREFDDPFKPVLLRPAPSSRQN